MILGMQLRHRALEVLALNDPASKAEQTRALLAAVHAGHGVLDPDSRLVSAVALPGRPALPRLVAADQVPRRSPFTLVGRAALLHAICHIEFNAIKIVYNQDPSKFLRFAVSSLQA